MDYSYFAALDCRDSRFGMPAQSLRLWVTEFVKQASCEYVPVSAIHYERLNMTSSLEPIAGVDLKGKTVLVRKKFFKPEYADKDRRFKCESGFGCNPAAMGNAVFGTFLLDGEETRINRSDIEGIVSE
jgi:hypothetical protein